MSALNEVDSDFFNIAQLPKEVKDRVLTHRDHCTYMLSEEMTWYKNDLTRDPTGVLQEWNFVLFPLKTKRFLIT